MVTLNRQTEKITKVLMEKGLRITKARIDILSYFFVHKKPISALKLKEYKAIKGLDESSIYRNITKLLEAKIIHEVPSSGDTKYYEILNPKDHHHHITCTRCETISCLHGCMIDEQIAKMAKTVGFAIDGHTLELYGTCKACLKPAKK